MANGGSAIRGSRVGAGPMGEQYRGFKSERVQRSYYCINGHVQEPMFAAHIDPSEIPDMIDCPNCGMPAGQDKKNPPEIAKHEPYKTHLAYVKERRTSDEAKSLLDEALASIRERRVKLAQEATKQAKLAAAKAAAAKVAAAKAAAAKAVKPKPVKKVEKPVAKKPLAKAAKPVAKKAVAKPATKSKTKAVAKPASKLKSSAKPVKKASKPTTKLAGKKSSKK
ncbi:rbpA RNA polymerase-binding protein RbpA [Microbacteriaceae bacterium]